MKRLLLVLSVLASQGVRAQTNWCVENPMPENKCDSHGDPATVHGGFTWHPSTDLQISTPAGEFELERFFFSDSTNNAGAWNQVLGQNNLPRPFNGPGTRVQWWHSLFSFVYLTSSHAIYVTGQTGNQHRFQAPSYCTSTSPYIPTGPCYWTRAETPEGRQLRSLSTGFIVTESDHSLRHYQAKFSASTNVYYLLTKLQTPEGATLADINYGAPAGTTNCPSSVPPPGEVAPYITSVVLAGGHTLSFRYLQQGSGNPCTLGAIDYQPTSGAGVELVSYTLATSPAGRIVAARFRDGGAGAESYSYLDGGFTVLRLGGQLFRHSWKADGGGPTGQTLTDVAVELTGTGNWPTATVLAQGGVPATYQPLTTAGANLTETSPTSGNGILLTTAIAGTSGDTNYTSATLTTTYVSARNLSVAHRRFRLRDTDTCTPSEACSAGENRYELRATPYTEAASNGDPTVSAVKDKRNNWVLTPKLPVFVVMEDGGFLNTGSYGFGQTPALESIRRGAYEDGGKVVDPLEREHYTYLSKPWARYAMETKKSPSAMAGLDGGMVTTTYSYDDTDAGLRMTREVTAGWTLASVTTGATEFRYRGTFYRPLAGDALQRVEFIEGPCWLDSAGATACSTSLNELDAGVAWPLTKFEYYASTSDTNSQRLAKLIRYPAGLNGSVQLVSEFSGYTPEGDPGKVRNYSVVSGLSSEIVVTDFVYSARRPVQQKVYRATTPTTDATTEWYYDEDQLTAVKYPEGNFEVMCYRANSSFPSCSGGLTKKLKWRAKTDSLSVSSWSERIEYSYDANGYETEERRYVYGDSNARYIHRTHPDLHGRATYSRTGSASSTQHYAPKAHFDGANNRDAFGPPANLPPDYCRNSGADSPLCWWFRYDRANRLNRAAAPGSPSLSRACFDYDVAGNITQVATGDTSLNCDQSLNAPSTSTPPTSTSTALQYTWDDFGNVIAVRNTGADTSGSLPTQYRYDAQGNVVEKRTPAMGTGVTQRFSYDGLGRLVRVVGGATELYRLDYDTPTVAAPAWMPTRDFTAGRLARHRDSYGETWYGYDYLGNTIAEYRERDTTSCNYATKGTHCRPHTTYEWDKNGNLSAITYPFGRRVTYLYGTGALRDRPSSISVELFLGGGSTSRSLVQGIAWEPYGGLRGYTAHLNATWTRGVEYYLGGDAEFEPASCGTALSSVADGSARVRGLFVSTSAFSPNPSGHVSGDVFAQYYRWSEDQVSHQRTCLSGATGTSYVQSFAYDSMQRLTNETMTNFPAFAGESASETKVFDTRGNRIDGTRDGYDVLDQTFDSNAKDRMTELCWWRNFLNPGQCFVGYGYAYNATGAMTQVNGLKGAGTAWSRSFEYPFTNALSDVYSAVTKTTGGGGPVLVMESFYDAFGRRRAKQNAVGDGQEFLYDLGHQLLVDSMWKTTASSVTADEYIWLDGRPLLVLRSNLTAKGGHKTDYVDEVDTGAGSCSRPIDDGQVNCGLFHLVSNLQGFVNVAIHDGTGLMADFMLPDADGTVNQPRMMSAGGYGTAWAQRFNVPSNFSKQARFRTSWTGGIPGWGGVISFELGGQTVLSPGADEVGQAWSAWGPTVTGATDVVWSTTCWGGCMSAADLFEWRTWETGAARFQTRLRFPGQYADAETDFYENWNRYYEHTTGRYLSADPLLHASAVERDRALDGRAMPTFGYAGNDPVNRFDPDGLLDYPEISCDDRRGFGYTPALSTPAKSECDDCEELKRRAKKACSAGDACNCDEADRVARHACFMCTVMKPSKKPQKAAPGKPVSCR